jgi:hypothetical protein
MRQACRNILLGFVEVPIVVRVALQAW